MKITLAAETGISNKRASMSTRHSMWRSCKPSSISAASRPLTRASPWADIKVFPDGITLLYDMCCRKAGISMTSMSSLRILSSYPVARMVLNMDHAQLRFDDPTAALQQSSAMHRYRLPGGLAARLFQNLAARNSQTWCNGLRSNSAKRMSVEVLLLTPVISLFGAGHTGSWAVPSGTRAAHTFAWQVAESLKVMEVQSAQSLILVKQYDD